MTFLILMVLIALGFGGYVLYRILRGEYDPTKKEFQLLRRDGKLIVRAAADMERVWWQPLQVPPPPEV